MIAALGLFVLAGAAAGAAAFGFFGYYWMLLWEQQKTHFGIDVDRCWKMLWERRGVRDVGSSEASE